MPKTIEGTSSKVQTIITSQSIKVYCRRKTDPTPRRVKMNDKMRCKPIFPFVINKTIIWIKNEKNKLPIAIPLAKPQIPHFGTSNNHESITISEYTKETIGFTITFFSDDE